VARSGALFRERSFYGVLQVVEVDDALGARRSLVSGRTLHGRQFLQTDRRTTATAYYAPTTGVGLAINNHPQRLHPNFSVGVVGLGVGTLAAYGRPGDRFTFYELDPNVVAVAKRYFTFLSDSRADVRVVVGDARLQMEHELVAGNAERFDMLVVDAFTGDAVPVHLLTAECMATYLRRLKPDGLIAFHISNRSLDLGRVVRGLAQQFRLQVALVNSPPDPATAASSAIWMILGPAGHPIFRQNQVAAATGDWPYGWVTPAFAAERLRITEAEVENRVRAGAIPVGRDRTGQRLVRIEVEDPAVSWTDDRSGIWEILRLN
jgi:SAM-dependent methyltransferase